MHGNLASCAAPRNPDQAGAESEPSMVIGYLYALLYGARSDDAGKGAWNGWLSSSRLYIADSKLKRV